MCGIAGFFDKGRNGQTCGVGRILLNMLNGLACRGPDSAGVAIFASDGDDRTILRIKMGDGDHGSALGEKLTRFLETNYAGRFDFSAQCNSARVAIAGAAGAHDIADTIEALDDAIEVVSQGQSLEIVKQVGSPAHLEEAYHVSTLTGTHGIGHTRLSTESKVDLSHSQPFGSHRLPDFAIVHNGHITNYHRLRRVYEQRHIRFYTENDSEVVAIYLADRMTNGSTLEQSLRSMQRDLDGSFSCLVATAGEFGFVKDPFALKPLLWAETQNFVALANEEIAIRSALPGNYEVREAQTGEVRVWQR